MSTPHPQPTDLDIVRSAYAAELDRIVAQAEGPVVQIGARASVLDRKATNWRQRFGGRAFIGLDIEPGENVDVVADICGDGDVLRAALGEVACRAVICPHVLEHVRKPWVAAKNIEKILAPGGLLFVQVPWVQAYHPFPDDYWRFSFAGVEALFDGVLFHDRFYSGGSSDYAYRVQSKGPVSGGPRSRPSSFRFCCLQTKTRASSGAAKI